MTPYRGRFAPSPTGPLHLGSLLAAVISILHARAHNGRWLVRIEDLDPPREVPGASQQIIDCLEAHALISDEPILYQSTRSNAYEARLRQLSDKGLVFRCPCSRKQLQANKGIHLPECQQQELSTQASAIRFRTDNQTFRWHDLFQGNQDLALEQDFVLKRKEGLYAYQLAVVNDDIDQGITHVVRGIDLLDSTPMQLALYQAFDSTPPSFGHFPVLVDEHNQKLSKQSCAPAVNPLAATDNLRYVMHLLKIPITRSMREPAEILAQALELWTTAGLTKASFTHVPMDR